MTDPSFDDAFVLPEPPPEEDDFAGEGGGHGANGYGTNSYGTRSVGNRSYDGRGRDANADGEGFRKPPHDLEAEQGVLGAMLLNGATIVDVVELLVPEDFYRVSHQLIYGAIISLFADNSEIDAVIVAARLDRNNELDRVGGAAYLHTLINRVPTAANARYYANIVAEKSLLRQLVDAGTRVVQLGYEGTEGAEVENVIDLAQQEVYKVAKKNATEDYAVFAEIVEPTLEELEALTSTKGQAGGVPTGFADLDALTNGLHGGQMIIVAARPGVGKSTLALDFVRNCTVRQNKAAVIFSLEMSKTEIAMRMISAEANVKLSDMRSGSLSTEEWTKMANRIDQIEQAPLFIDDSANLTMMEIRAKARRLKQKHDLQLIVVDYLQLMSSGKRVESRQQEVSEFSRQLKLLAKELDVPLVAISQLNRGPEARTDKRPQLADLRESGSLEQDADMVMLLYRPDSQDRDDPRAGEADIILAKHRGGPIDTVQVAHQLHYSKFVDMARG